MVDHTYQQKILSGYDRITRAVRLNLLEHYPAKLMLDHAMGKILGLGFTRQGTLADDAAVCDCRWKRGTETPGWIPAVEKPIYA